MNTRYMYRNKWTDEHAFYYSKDYESYDEPYLKVIKNGTILPTIPAEGLHWGAGGVLDENDDFVQESSVGYRAFGRRYNYSKNDVVNTKQKAVFIGIVPKHWGHFLIDTVCRLWPLIDEKYKNYKVAFCGFGWNENRIDGNYLELFETIGIDESNLLFIDKIYRFTEIIIPGPTMDYGTTFHKKYKEICRYIVQNAIENKKCFNLQPLPKIYFSRLDFFGSRINEVGEKEIAESFQDNGFKIISPESLSFVEQVFYIHNCICMASLSGTIPHNAIFAKEGTEILILNRTGLYNPPQLRINQLFDLNVTYIDVYKGWNMYHSVDYGYGPFHIGVTDNLKLFFNDRGYKLAGKNHLAEILKIFNESFQITGILILRTVRKNKYINNMLKKLKHLKSHKQ